jgi:GNAT superfamily N-acetyltransferase
LSVRPLRPGEIGKASRLLGRAFAPDPFIAHVFGSPWRRRLAYPPFFRAGMYESATESYALELDGELAGVAVWVPPEPGPGRRARARVNRAAVRLLFPRAAPRLFAVFEELGRLHPHEPHWYLFFVGLEPRHQGKGLGAELLAPVLEKAETLCYLETPFEGTHPFYRRLGFEVSAELHPLAGAPPVWTMTRRL